MEDLKVIAQLVKTARDEADKARDKIAEFDLDRAVYDHVIRKLDNILQFLGG